MPERAERAPRKPYVTSASKREAWIEKIQDRYNRTPTANELLALDNLPCAPHLQLFDRSRPGVAVYQRLRYFEANGDVSLLEEAGRMLREQMSNSWTPATSVNGDQSSMTNVWTPVTSVNSNRSSIENVWTPVSSVAGDQNPIADLSEKHGFPQPPRQENASAQAEIPNIYGSKDMPFRPNTISSPAQNSFLSTDPVPAVKAHIIRGDVYYMPITLTFNSEASNSSIAINVPGRATATYPEPLTTAARSGAVERPSVSVMNGGSAGIAKSNGDFLPAGL